MLFKKFAKLFRDRTKLSIKFAKFVQDRTRKLTFFVQKTSDPNTASFCGSWRLVNNTLISLTTGQFLLYVDPR